MPVKTEDEIKKAALTLIEKGLKNIIVTMGCRGSIWLTKDSIQQIPAYQVNAVDSSGAGDAYIGCFADTYVKTKDVLSAMKKASAFAALSVTARGTQSSYPSKEQLEDFLAKQK
jgi:ribokinase